MMEEEREEEEDGRESLAAGTENFDGQLLIDGSGKKTVISLDELDRVLRQKMTILEAHWTIIGPIIAEIKSIKEKHNALREEKVENPLLYSISGSNFNDKKDNNKVPIIDSLENVSNSVNDCNTVENPSKDVPSLRCNSIPLTTCQNATESVFYEKKYNSENNTDKKYNLASDINSWEFNNEVDGLSIKDKWNCFAGLDYRCIDEKQPTICIDEAEKQSSLVPSNLNIPDIENTKHNTLNSSDSVFLPTNCNLESVESIQRRQNQLLNIDKAIFDLSIIHTSALECFNEQYKNPDNNQYNSEQMFKMSESDDVESNPLKENIRNMSKETEIDFLKIERVFEKMLFYLKEEELKVERKSNQSEIVEAEEDVNVCQSDEVSSVERNTEKLSRCSILQEINTREQDAQQTLQLFRRIGETCRHVSSFKCATLQQILLNNLITDVEIVCKYASQLQQNFT